MEATEVAYIHTYRRPHKYDMCTHVNTLVYICLSQDVGVLDLTDRLMDGSIRYHQLFTSLGGGDDFAKVLD